MKPSADRYDHRAFVDALRDFLDLPPLYTLCDETKRPQLERFHVQPVGANMHAKPTSRIDPLGNRWRG